MLQTRDQLKDEAAACLLLTPSGLHNACRSCTRRTFEAKRHWKTCPNCGRAENRPLFAYRWNFIVCEAFQRLHGMTLPFMSRIPKALLCPRKKVFRAALPNTGYEPNAVLSHAALEIDEYASEWKWWWTPPRYGRRWSWKSFLEPEGQGGT